jgi:valyl-tRNA synthetase
LTQAKLDGGRNFTNKLWNAARFVLANQPDGAQRGTGEPTLAVRWIRSRLADATERATRQLDGLDLGGYAATVHDVAWSDYCDWFLEMAKVDLRREDVDADDRATTWAAAADGLATLLRLLHPLMPFVTEEIWQVLREVAPTTADEPLLITARWPRAGERDREAEGAFSDLSALVRGVRNLRTEAGSQASAWIPLMIEPANRRAADALGRDSRYLEALARVRPIELLAAEERQRPPRVTSSRVGVAWLGEDTVAQEAGEARRSAQLGDLDRNIARLEDLLASEDFSQRAPAAVVERERARLDELREQRARLA